MPSSEGFFSRLTRILTGKKKSPAPPPRSVGAPRPPSRKSAAKKRAAKKRPAKKRAGQEACGQEARGQEARGQEARRPRSARPRSARQRGRRPRSAPRAAPGSRRRRSAPLAGSRRPRSVPLAGSPRRRSARPAGSASSARAGRARRTRATRPAAWSRAACRRRSRPAREASRRGSRRGAGRQAAGRPRACRRVARAPTPTMRSARSTPRPASSPPSGLCHRGLPRRRCVRSVRRAAGASSGCVNGTTAQAAAESSSAPPGSRASPRCGHEALEDLGGGGVVPRSRCRVGRPRRSRRSPRALASLSRRLEPPWATATQPSASPAAARPRTGVPLGMKRAAAARSSRPRNAATLAASRRCPDAASASAPAAASRGQT